MMRRWWLVACLIACAQPVSVVSAATMAAREYALPNGLRVLLLPDSLAPVVDIALWFRAGSAWEGAGQSGATVLMEQRMNHGAFADRMRSLRERGANVGSLSTAEYSTFWITAPPASVVEALQPGRAGFWRHGTALSRHARKERCVRAARKAGLLPSYAAEYAGHPTPRRLPAGEGARGDDAGELRRGRRATLLRSGADARGA